MRRLSPVVSTAVCTAVCAALTATLVPLSLVNAPEAAAQGCTAVHVLQAAGTGFSSRADTDAPVDLHFDGTNIADELQLRMGARRVSVENVPYPSSLGRFSAFQTSTRGSENLTYGESVAVGVDAASEAMALKARHCPGTKFILVGHSQGSSVVGDTAARVAAGGVPGVTADRVAAVVMFADPGRSPAVGGAGPLPDSRFGANGELIVGGGTGVPDGREGMTGPRAGRFTGMEGRVISLCHSRDMACSSMPGSLVRDVADYGNRREVEGVSDTITAASIQTFVEATGQGVPPLEAAAQAGLGLGQLWSLVGTGVEVRELFRILHAHSRGDLNEAELVGLCLVAALPNIIKTGVRTDYLLKAVSALSGLVEGQDTSGNEGLDDAKAVLGSGLELFKIYAGLEDLYLQLGHAGLLPDALTGGTEAGAVARTPSAARQAVAHDVSQKALEQLAERAGLGGKLRDPRNAELIAGMQLAGDFGNSHTSYFNQFEGTYAIAGRTGADWVVDWLESIVRRT